MVDEILGGNLPFDKLTASPFLNEGAPLWLTGELMKLNGLEGNERGDLIGGVFLLMGTNLPDTEVGWSFEGKARFNLGLRAGFIPNDGITGFLCIGLSFVWISGECGFVICSANCCLFGTCSDKGAGGDSSRGEVGLFLWGGEKCFVIAGSMVSPCSDCSGEGERRNGEWFLGCKNPLVSGYEKKNHGIVSC